VLAAAAPAVSRWGALFRCFSSDERQFKPPDAVMRSPVSHAD